MHEITHYLVKRVGKNTYIFWHSKRGKPLDSSKYDFNNNDVKKWSKFLNNIELINDPKNSNYQAAHSMQPEQCNLALPNEALDSPLHFLMPVFGQVINFSWSKGKDSFCITNVNQTKRDLTLFFRPRNKNSDRDENLIFTASPAAHYLKNGSLNIKAFTQVFKNKSTKVNSEVINQTDGTAELIIEAQTLRSNRLVAHMFIKTINHHVYTFSYVRFIPMEAKYNFSNAITKQWSRFFNKDLSFISDPNPPKKAQKGNHILLSKPQSNGNKEYVEVFGPDILK